MQQSGNARQVSWGAVCNHSAGFASLRREGSRGTRKKAPAATEPNAFDFLNTKIEELGINDDTLLGCGINVVGCYERLLEGCSRFLSYYGIKVDFVPPQEGSYIDKLTSLINYFDERVQSLGYEFVAVSRAPYNTESSDLDFIVYRWGKEFEETVVVLYCCPAVYMSEEGGRWYKQFMKFASDSMAVNLGANSDNYQLDMTLEMAIEEAEADPDEELRVGTGTAASIAKEYKTGLFKKLFDEIERMPKMTAKQLIDGLEDYKSRCPMNEQDLIECLIEGVPVVARANVFAFDFNPDDSGIQADEDEDNWLSGPLSTAILYSRNDGIGEAMIGNINSGINSGTLGYTWSRFLCVSNGLKAEDVKEFEADRDFLPRFDEWLYMFNKETEKFDKYEC